MRMLAEEAGVSFATPFNLFGSKGEVLSALLHAKLSGAWQAQKQMEKQDDPVRKLVNLATCVVKTVTSNTSLVRPLLQSVGETEGLDHASAYGWALETWKEALHEAQEAKLIDPKADVDFYACSMHMIVRGGLSLWLHEELTNEQYEKQVSVSVAAILSSLSCDR